MSLTSTDDDGKFLIHRHTWTKTKKKKKKLNENVLAKQCVRACERVYVSVCIKCTNLNCVFFSRTEQVDSSNSTT